MKEKELEKAAEALGTLAATCTCKRPTISLPGGGAQAPGPHTPRCVSQVAKAALSALKQVTAKQSVSQDYLDRVSLEAANHIAAFTPFRGDEDVKNPTQWKARVQLEVQRALRLMPFEQVAAKEED